MSGNASFKKDPRGGWSFYFKGKYVGRYDTKTQAKAALADLQKHRNAQARGTRYERAHKNPSIFGGIFLNNGR